MEQNKLVFETTHGEFNLGTRAPFIELGVLKIVEAYGMFRDDVIQKQDFYYKNGQFTEAVKDIAEYLGQEPETIKGEIKHTLTAFKTLLYQVESQVRYVFQTDVKYRAYLRALTALTELQMNEQEYMNSLGVPTDDWKFEQVLIRLYRIMADHPMDRLIELPPMQDTTEVVSENIMM